MQVDLEQHSSSKTEDNNRNIWLNTESVYKCYIFVICFALQVSDI